MLAFGLCGLAASTAFLIVATGRYPLGSPGFLWWTGLASLAYVGALATVPRVPLRRTSFVLAALLTLAMRVPMTAADAGARSDMLRYVWDARAQRAGISPYEAIPSRPEFAALHTEATRQMNNRNITSPYPPGAQLFFRWVTTVHESTLALKIALVLCDLAIVALLVAWLRGLDRNPLWALAYAWNPLVVLETAYSGHLDAAGALAVTMAAYALWRGRAAISVTALAIGIAIKFLPIVLLPLYWRRVRLTHAALGAAVIAALYAPFVDWTRGSVPIGSVANMIRGFRFNGPVFQALELVLDPWTAAMGGAVIGLAVAAVMRWRSSTTEPAAWAWPMAAALLCAPVIYPWYLLWLTPFFVSAGAAPLALWTLLILPVYVVWHGVVTNGVWAVPAWMLVVEFGGLAAATCWIAVRRTRSPAHATTPLVRA